MIPKSFKTAVANPDVSDVQIEKMFLALEVENEKDVIEGCRFLEKHRPAVVSRILARAKTSQKA